MSVSFARVGQALRLGPGWGRLIVAAALAGIIVLVAQATRMGLLPSALGLAVAALIALVSLRWPLLALAAFVVMIPIEEVVVIEALGTVSRFAGILFAVSYGVPRLARTSGLSLGAMPPAAWAFLAWAGVSLGWAISPNTAWMEIPTLLQLFIVAALVADIVVQRPAIVRPILWVYSVSAAATALVGIQSFVALGPDAEVRAAALEHQNPAQFAAVLLPALVFGLYEVLNGKRWILGGAVALLTTAGLLVSGTRGAWLAVALVVLLFIFPRLRPRRRISAIALILVIGVVTLQIPGVSNLVLQRAETAVATGGAGRTDIWVVAATIYGSAPVLGVGYANFPVAYTQDAVRSSDVSAGAAFIGGGGPLGPHNLVIGTLVELGPIGLLLLALFLLPLVLRPGWGPDAATVQAALASLLTLALFLDILANRKQVWLVIGLAAGLAFVQRKARKARKALPDGDPANADAHPRRVPDHGATIRVPRVASLPERQA